MVNCIFLLIIILSFHLQKALIWAKLHSIFLASCRVCQNLDCTHGPHLKNSPQVRRMPRGVLTRSHFLFFFFFLKVYVIIIYIYFFFKRTYGKLKRWVFSYSEKRRKLATIFIYSEPLRLSSKYSKTPSQAAKTEQVKKQETRKHRERDEGEAEPIWRSGQSPDSAML